jgi:hypothetical protein
VAGNYEGIDLALVGALAAEWGAAGEQFAARVIRVPVRNAVEIERSIEAFVGEPHGGLILLPPAGAPDDRDLISRLSMVHRLPAFHQNNSTPSRAA